MMHAKARLLVALVLNGCISFGYLLAVTSSNAQAGPAPATQPDIDLLRNVLAKHHLLLSSGRDSASDYFSLSFSVDTQLHRDLYTLPQILVARDKDRVGAVELTKNGLCYAYLIAGEMLVVDHDHPGSLCRLKGGFPSFIFQSKNNELEAILGFDQALDRPEVTADFGSIFDLMISRSISCLYERKDNTYTVQDPQLVAHCAFFSNENAPFVLKSILLKRQDGIVSISILDGPEAAHQIAALPQSINEKLSRLDVTLTDQDSVSDKWFVIPADFGKDPRETAAAEKLTTLVFGVPTTMPSTRISPDGTP